jgi:hypothetical protein
MAETIGAARGAVSSLIRDLDRVFGARLLSVATYESHERDDRIHTLAVVESLGFDDLAACVPLADSWMRHRLAIPLLLADAELRRTLDIFPLEYSAMRATLTVVRGRNPFDGAAPDPADLRRAIETQAKSHLIHLREGFLESRGEVQAVAALVVASAAPFRTLLSSIARLLDGDRTATRVDDAALAAVAQDRLGMSAETVREVFAAASSGHVTITDPAALLARYLVAAERAWQYVDEWRQ